MAVALCEDGQVASAASCALYETLLPALAVTAPGHLERAGHAPCRSKKLVM